MTVIPLMTQVKNALSLNLEIAKIQEHGQDLQYQGYQKAKWH